MEGRSGKLGVLATLSLPASIMARLTECCQVSQVASREDLLAQLPGHSVLLCTSFDQVDGDLLEAGPDLVAVVTLSAGFNHVKTDLLRQRGVRLGK